MSPIALTTVAMTTAGIMLAHQVASKAFRDAAFLERLAGHGPAGDDAGHGGAGRWRSCRLFSRLLVRFSPLAVVTAGFAAERRRPRCSNGPSTTGAAWIVVVIYLHLAGVSALLLSGFWSLIAERFDPARGTRVLRTHRRRRHAGRRRRQHRRGARRHDGAASTRSCCCWPRCTSRAPWASSPMRRAPALLPHQADAGGARHQPARAVCARRTCERWRRSWS